MVRSKDWHSLEIVQTYGSLSETSWNLFIPPLAWVPLYGLAYVSSSVLKLSDRTRFRVFFAETISCLIVSLYLCYVVHGYWHNLVHIAATGATLLVLFTRLIVSEKAPFIGKWGPSVFDIVVIAFWLICFTASLFFAALRHRGSIVSLNAIQVGTVTLWGVLLSWRWLIKPKFPAVNGVENTAESNRDHEATNGNRSGESGNSSQRSFGLRPPQSPDGEGLRYKIVHSGRPLVIGEKQLLDQLDNLGHVALCVDDIRRQVWIYGNKIDVKGSAYALARYFAGTAPGDLHRYEAMCSRVWPNSIPVTRNQCRWRVNKAFRKLIKSAGALDGVLPLVEGEGYQVLSTAELILISSRLG